MSIATYSFLPYLRQGLANNLKNTGGSRAIYTVKLAVTNESGTKENLPDRDVELYGPGDVVGIDPRVILKTDPLNWITNFEPNYVSYVDFYDEDFPWRYTPVQPDATHRLKPWITLIVLKESEFEDGKNMLNRPLPYIIPKGVNAGDIFPKTDQLWAWAHVQVNSDIVGTTVKDTAADVNGVLNSLQTLLDDDPDMAYSRLICPRKLEPDTTYHAFIIPTFLSGLNAGLGKDAATIAAAGTKISWQDSMPAELPHYYRWQFATGTVGDFEYLVRLLKPKPCDLRVGRRDMDMTRPGANLQWEEASDLDLRGILRLGGALRVPRKTLPEDERKLLDRLDGWGKDRLPHPFQKQIAALLNLADEYSYKPADDANTDAKLPIDPNEDADPLITPPIYGRWHAMVERVLTDRANAPIHHNYNWITELNLDPRYRVPAHFGTRVVQENQEDYMNAAWEQIGEVLKGNKQIRFAQFAQAASKIYYQKHVVQLKATRPSKVMMLTAPVQPRVVMDGATVFHTVRESVLPTAVLSPAIRRITRPRGRFIKTLQTHATDKTFQPETLIDELRDGNIHVAPKKELAPGMVSAVKIGDLFTQTGIPGIVTKLLRQFPWLPTMMLILAIILLIIFLLIGGWIASGVGVAIAGVVAYLARRFATWKKQLHAADAIKPENQKPAAVDDLPKSGGFKLLTWNGTFNPTVGGTVDSADAVEFKKGLRGAFELIQASRESLPKPKLYKKIDTDKVTDFVVSKIDPTVTIPAWTWQHIQIPAWIKSQLDAETFTEAKAYPRFDLPMYKPLAAISAELFLPNINLIEYNSITLLESNQAFIEAYMVGLNHEFARELLWREYPTDQRGSYFRQFWDVSTLLNAENPTNDPDKAEEIREKYRDIPKLHRWPRASPLGSHDHRQKPGEPELEEVVLVIRGELLKKYPNAVIYAHKATWQRDETPQHNFDKRQSRILYQEAEGDKSEPSFDVIRTPLYKAQVDPDITFFGFKLDVKDAKGESDPQTPTLKNAGWFFVIKERPGEPRFGFDVPKADVDSAPNLTWNDLSWSEVLPGNGVIDVNLATPPSISPTAPESDSPSFLAQREEDKKIFWNTNGHAVDAADMAYILYQVPVLVAVHASEMLPKTD
jgi:hypothetical protein